MDRQLNRPTVTIFLTLEGRVELLSCWEMYHTVCLSLSLLLSQTHTQTPVLSIMSDRSETSHNTESKTRRTGFTGDKEKGPTLQNRSIFSNPLIMMDKKYISFYRSSLQMLIQSASDSFCRVKVQRPQHLEC